LRVLQERQVVRLGSRKPIPLNVRVIAATNIDVSEAVGSGKFRLDLYFRLSVVSLELPPLRVRRADILPLAEHFIALYSGRLQQTAPILDAEAREALLSYSWPGNVRELENVMHGAVLVSIDGVIRRSDLRLVTWIAKPSTVTSTDEFVDELSPLEVDEVEHALTPQLDKLFAQAPDRLFESVESLVIHRAMRHCNGNQVHTARLLGISRNVLRTYLRRFGLIGTDGSRDTPREAEVKSIAARHTGSSFARYPLHYRSEPVGEIA
jgi:sigma-54 dependent transcriptional regulator